jgi:alcohol dehydrogenase (cytochrome c)
MSHHLTPIALAAVAAVLTLGCGGDHPASGSRSDSATTYPTTAAADSAHRRAMADTAGWASYGRDYSNQRFSPLTQIDTTNVATLAPAWVNHSGIPHSSESNPVVVDGVMYLSTALNHVLALDAATGAKRWEYAHKYRTTVDCCAAVNRGVTVYGGRVFMGTVDARLVALDARNGHLLWDVTVGDNMLGYHLTGTPTVVDGKVITGVSGGEQGCRCYVDAYDAATGKRIWRWYTIPSPEEGGWWGTWREHDEWGQSFARNIAQEKHDSAKYADAWQHGGGPVWHHPAYDPATGLLFVNVGNPAPDEDGGIRPGDNLYSNSIVALNAETGKLRWYYQEISHDLWDYDATSPAVLVDAPDSTGHLVKAVAEAGKDGYVYLLDRATGHPIRKSQPIVPLEHYMQVPTAAGIIISPGTLGGSDWSPPAYNPATGYLYVDGSYIPMKYKLKHEELRPPAQYWGGTVVATPSGHYGLFSAVDLATGKIAWQKRTDAPLIGGAVATAGGVVFTGTSDKHFIAFNARTGRELWRADAPAAINAPPITYAIRGRQYVAVAATGLQTLNTPRGDALLVYALPAAGGASK